MSAAPKISVYLITLNEGRYLEEVLSSVRGADEIVIVDSGSSDDTLSIAERHGARVIHQAWLGYAAQKAFALEQCSHDWVLNLDGDEVLPAGAIEQLRELAASNQADGYWLKRDDWWFGGKLPGAKRYKFCRFYRKSKAHWDVTQYVHEHIYIDGTTEQTDITIKHYGYDTVHGYMAKLNSYSELKARVRSERNRKVSLLRLLLIYPLMFLKFYLLRGMIFSGWRGFVKAHIDAFYFFLTEAKLYEQRYRSKK
ncbi:glycosyltransferase family 2 protein [Pseudidiomarina aestuarii]|uniref:Glycosyltransferase family 2 protein n=1 Tax=Pseudidiomarina aestuarii TaxID=624146 RepID=A0A2T4CNH8_9GAMM|nr:glycosyltransferase family 2 protein [Pseudidiomarina aestuarii]